MYVYVYDHFRSSLLLSKETVPKDVSWNREKKWLEMLDNWDFWMRKKFYKVHKLV